MWRSTGFLMSFATVAELAGLVGFLVVMAGGRAKRERGWPIMAVVMLAVAAVQFGAMAIVVSVFSGSFFSLSRSSPFSLGVMVAVMPC